MYLILYPLLCFTSHFAPHNALYLLTRRVSQLVDWSYA